MDRRLHERSDIETPAKFSWKDPEAIRNHRGQGATRNLSLGGVFVSTGDRPPLGARVRLHVSFRSAHPDSRLVLHATARVVRAESGSQAGLPTGFAATFETYTLRNEKEIVERRM